MENIFKTGSGEFYKLTEEGVKQILGIPMSEIDQDAINPSHYNSTKISAFDVIDDWGLDFYLGNVVKYIQRAGKKENNSELQDLRKAQRYLEKKIELIEKESDDK